MSFAKYKSSDKKHFSCVYHPFLDKIVMTDGRVVNSRRDTNGRFLLSTMFALKACNEEEEIAIEMPFSHAVQLKDVVDHAMTLNAPENEETSSKYDLKQMSSQLNEKLSQEISEQTSVVLKLPQSHFCHNLAWLMTIAGDTMHCAKHSRNHLLSNTATSPMKSMLQGDISGLKSSKVALQHHSVLPIIASLYLQAIMAIDSEIPKEYMFSEAFRYETFIEWPHVDYEWAGPGLMALAGFYYHPISRAEDRALCFQCGVSLVSWEPTDEPWSEHERHAPSCPMVTGDITSNVPLSESESFELAQVIHTQPQPSPVEQNGTDSDFENCQILVSQYDGLFITASSRGSVVIWDASRQLKRCSSFFFMPDQVATGCKDSKWDYTSFCLPEPTMELDNEPMESRNMRKSSLGKNKLEDENIKVVCGGSFGGALFLMEYVLEGPLWSDSRCQTGARSGAQPPFASAASVPLNDQMNLLQYDIWDDDSPPYDENSDEDGDELKQMELEQQVTKSAFSAILDDVTDHKASKTPPIDKSPSEGPSVSNLRHVSVPILHGPSGVEVVSAKRVVKLPECFQEDSKFFISSVNYMNQHLIVVLNDNDSANRKCFVCDNKSQSENDLGGIVVYKYRLGSKRGGTQSGMAEQQFDQPVANFTVPSFLQSKILNKPPGIF